MLIVQIQLERLYLHVLRLKTALELLDDVVSVRNVKLELAVFLLYVLDPLPLEGVILDHVQFRLVLHLQLLELFLSILDLSQVLFDCIVFLLELLSQHEDLLLHHLQIFLVLAVITLGLQERNLNFLLLILSLQLFVLFLRRLDLIFESRVLHFEPGVVVLEFLQLDLHFFDYFTSLRVGD